MLKFDRTNFLQLLKDFPAQIPEALSLTSDFSFNFDIADINNIVIAGMGGSAISGDLILGYIREELAVPAIVNRGYDIPHFVNDKTLFIALSYSGDTEETLASTRAAMAHSAKVVAITSGGELQDICIQNGYPYVQVPGGLPPRQALGYLFFPLLRMFEKSKMIASKEAEIAETVLLLKDLVERYNPKTNFGNNLANHISQSIYHAIPVIYTGAQYLYGVPVRWQNQFNENAKVLSYSNRFPELNHNEIMGFEGLPEVNKHFRIILLREENENLRIKERIRVTKKILRKHKILFGEVFAEGNTRLARMFSLIFTGDWASYYLAMLNEKDPMTIESIDFLKEKLSEVGV